MNNNAHRRPPRPGKFKSYGGKPAFRPRQSEAVTPSDKFIFGLHPVEAALANPHRRILKAEMTDNAERKLASQLAARSIAPERTTPRDLDRLLGSDTVHQGALLHVEPLEEPTFEELLARAGGRPLVVLDQVTDPHNVGAILRSVAVFGGCGLVMTRRHSPPLNGVLAKSASGALDMVPVALVQNLATALQELKDIGFVLLGLDSEASERLEETDWSKPVAIVLGAEGKGLRQLTRELCNQLVSITTGGPLASMNVSNAAAIALHESAFKRNA